MSELQSGNVERLLHPPNYELWLSYSINQRGNSFFLTKTLIEKLLECKILQKISF